MIELEPTAADLRAQAAMLLAKAKELEAQAPPRIEYWRARLEEANAWDSEDCLTWQEMRASTKKGTLQVASESTPPANLVSSKIRDGFHLPVIDLDMNCRLVPSRTKGAYHLYIDREVATADYQEFLDAGADAGIINNGFRNQLLAFGATFVRKEGTFDPHSRSNPDKVDWRMK